MVHDTEDTEPEPESPSSHPYKPVQRFPHRHDAFHTILQWLYHRIPHTRGNA